MIVVAGLVAALAVSVAAVAAAVAASAQGRSRALAARVDAAVSRLGDDGSATAAGGGGGGIGRLERAVDRLLADQDRQEATVERLQRAFDTIPQGVVLTDETGEVVYRNAVAETFSSARHADALVEAAVHEMVADAVDGRGGTRTLDLFGPPRRTLVVTTMPMRAGRTGGVVAVIDDVTERRRLEAVRRDFVANISHELKTPVGALGLLAETLVSEDDAAVRARLANRVQTEAFRVGRTIEDLLELSRIETSELPNREAVPVGVVVAEAAERIRPAAEQAGIEIEVDEPNRRLAVLGDRRQLVSALANLLDNAVKYSEADGVVEVCASTDGRMVDIAVRDHGIGIPARDLERVFERFYRVDQARGRQTGGTGLGLSIVRHVVGNHQGEVHVESRLGEGSTFTLLLPSASGPVLLDEPIGDAG